MNIHTASPGLTERVNSNCSDRWGGRGATLLCGLQTKFITPVVLQHCATCAVLDLFDTPNLMESELPLGL